MDAKRSKYIINGIEFRSKKSVQDYCRAIKDRATGGIEPEWGVYFQLDSDDERFMLDFIRFHPSYADIAGSGVSFIQVGCVGPDVGKPHWSFYAIRNDGSERLFGFSKFGMTPAQSEGRNITAAKRNAVEDQTVGYKEQYFDGQQEAFCEATGELINRNACHVDHASPTFIELDRAFFGDWEPDVFDDGYKWQLADKQLKAAWQEYHQANAVLRCVTEKFNLSRRDAADESP